MAVSDYSTTPADNTSISGLTVTDATVADTLDNIIRQMMADIRTADDANAKTAANETITGNWTFAGTTIANLGTVATVDINGGTWDGGSIGASTPVTEGRFTALDAGDIDVIDASAAVIDLIRTGDANTHEMTRISRENNTFNIKTRDSAGNLVATDYAMTVGASGATEHSWRVEGSEVFILSTTGIEFYPNGTSDGAEMSTTTFRPSIDGGLSLGRTLNRWSDCYLQNAPNVSSDARLKDNIQDLTDAERRAAAKIKTRTFTMKDTGQKKVGYIAQEIIEAMASEGLDAFEYGLVSDGETYGVDYDAINAFRLG